MAEGQPKKTRVKDDGPKKTLPPKSSNLKPADFEHFRLGAHKVLQSFLDRPRLYQGEHAVALLEAQARINLAAALSRLAQ